jgi:crotonobetainyl-CoA hydratase
MSEPAVTYGVQGHVAVLTLDRPEAMNAVNAALSTALGEGVERAAADPAVRVLLLTGKGRAFSAGADLKALAAGEPIGAEGHDEWGFAGFVRHWVDKPVVAAVNGFALGGGTELALACDLVVASTEARFGLPEVTRGLFAAAGGVIRLQRQIPAKRAAEIALTGQPIDAATALAWGLVNRVVAPDDLLPTALALAEAVAGNAPTAVRQTKRMLHRGAAAGSDWDATWTGEDPWTANDEALATVFGHPDAIEGPTAFAEKRDPAGGTSST